jgi:hypothetical protein
VCIIGHKICVWAASSHVWWCASWSGNWAVREKKKQTVLFRLWTYLV